MNGSHDEKNNDALSRRDDMAVNSRREFLKKAGKIAVYTPPAMMMLVHPSVNAITKSACASNGGYDYNYISTEELNQRRTFFYKLFMEYERWKSSFFSNN